MLIWDRINIYKIIKKHFGTFYNYGEFKINGKKETLIGDWITFLALPILISIILYLIEIRFTETYIDLIITSLSIFIGLLFSLLALVFDLTTKAKEDYKIKPNNRKAEAKYTLIKELFINISFSIILSIITIVVLFLTRLRPIILVDFLKDKFVYFNYLKIAYISISNTSGFFLLIQFIITLMMILKRFFIIFLDEFDETKKI